MNNKIQLVCSLLIFFTLASCGSSRGRKDTSSTDEQQKISRQFLESFVSFCGNEFTGTIHTSKSTPDWEGGMLYITFVSCTESEVRLAVLWPSDEKTIIIMTLMDEEILLKHDLRNADLTPAEFTMYGGFSTADGTNERQQFPAHSFSGDMWPGYEDYSWEISLLAREKIFSYTEKSGTQITKNFSVSLD